MAVEGGGSGGGVWWVTGGGGEACKLEGICMYGSIGVYGSIMKPCHRRASW